MAQLPTTPFIKGVQVREQPGNEYTNMEVTQCAKNRYKLRHNVRIYGLPFLLFSVPIRRFLYASTVESAETIYSYHVYLNITIIK